jgi:hypothetical protein
MIYNTVKATRNGQYKILFTAESKTLAKATKRKENLERDVNSDGYTRWSGKERIAAVQHCKDGGWDFEVITTVPVTL